MRAEPNYPIESVDRALTLLALFKNRHALRLVDAAQTLGVAKSTAHRLLAMLQHHGLVEQEDATRLYHVGPELIDIGLAVTGSYDVRAVARPYLEALVAELDETVHLVTLRGTDMVFLDGIESSKPVRAAKRVGTSLPAHATAGGKALLARLPDEAFLRLYPSEKLVRATPSTHGNRKRLLKELHAIRTRGHAGNNGESEPELAAIACAIQGRSGQVRIGITVSGPSQRILAARDSRIVPALLRIAARAGEAMS